MTGYPDVADSGWIVLFVYPVAAGYATQENYTRSKDGIRWCFGRCDRYNGKKRSRTQSSCHGVI